MRIQMTRIVLVPAVLLVTLSPCAAQQLPQMFATSDECLACHNGLITPSGEDVSIGSDWRASMMAHSARDPYWQASVRREAAVHPDASQAIQHECAACHMPMARFRAEAVGAKHPVFAHLPIAQQKSPVGLLAADGVSCAMCHQIQSEGLGTPDSFTAGFVVDTTTPIGDRPAFGPFEVDDGRTTLMQSASRFVPEKATHVQQSELCATCHTLYTHALEGDDDVVFPEQVPYLEWKHSAYAESRSCQSCHMPVVEEPVAVTGVLGEPREQVSRHVFRGGNFFMPRMLNSLRDELGVVAEPQELDTTARRTAAHLETSSATLAVEDVRRSGDRLELDVLVSSLTGHKLPSAYPSRRAWLHLQVFDRQGRQLFSSGGLDPSGTIAGNDNDRDAARFEPHYTEITSGDQVQIYEAILGAPGGEVTTVLLSAVDYLKDNRLLPTGFDKATAHADIAVHGEAAGDDDFVGGSDRVRYMVDVRDADGPFQVTAELWYQPIGFRWAHNLSEQPSVETDRFVAAFDRLATSSGIVLARASAISE